MPGTDVYTILRRATSAEDETLWREVVTIEAGYLPAAMDEHVRRAQESGLSPAGQYLVVQEGSFAAKRYVVTARTEYDVEETELVEVPA